MSTAAAAKIFSGPAGYALAIGVGGIVFYMLYKTLGADLKKGAKAVGSAATTLGTSIWNAPGTADSANNLNRGTPYAGTVVVGSLGNIVNQGLGGAPQSIGEWLAGILPGSGNDYDPNAVTADRNSPPKATSTVSSPVAPAPTILQYSFKQANIDTPSLLLTDDLFTPGYGSGGGYAESGTPGTAGNFSLDYSLIQPDSSSVL